jgi:hypothetical protein
MDDCVYSTVKIQVWTCLVLVSVYLSNGWLGTTCEAKAIGSHRWRAVVQVMAKFRVAEVAKSF